MLNCVILNGKLPHFEPNNYTATNGDKKGVLNWALSVRRDFKKNDEQYYPEDLIPFTAFGNNADFIMKNFNQGDGIIIEGRLQRSDDYNDKNTGETKKGQLFVLVSSVKFAESKSSETTKTNNQTRPSVPGARTAPQVPGGRSVPPTSGQKPPTLPRVPGAPSYVNR